MPAVFHLAKGSPHHLGNAFDHVDVAGPLRDPLVVVDGIEAGMDTDTAPFRATREQEHGHGVRKALRYATEGVFSAWTSLHRKDADLSTGVDPTKAICHVNACTLLAADDGSNAFLGHSVY